MEESIMVMEKARPHLDALSKLAPELNRATDFYTSELEEIQEQLNKLKLGIPIELNGWIKTTNNHVRVNDDGEPIGVVYTGWTLAYSKIRDWGFIVREYEVQNDSNVEPVLQNMMPLLEAARDLRIAAAEKIPDLLKEIEKEVRKKIETLAKVSDKR